LAWIGAHWKPAQHANIREAQMAKLIYSAISSLDGYVADAEGNFDWSAPDQEVHEFVNDLERPIGTYLFGRRMYEVMRYWDTAPTGNREPSAEQEYAKIWQAADKIIYSKSLEDVSTARTRIERGSIPTRSSNSKLLRLATSRWAVRRLLPKH
jgi:RibD C-terminal domain